jgi:hypothetical protein
VAFSEALFVSSLHITGMIRVKECHVSRKCSTYRTEEMPLSVGDMKEGYHFDDRNDDIKIDHKEIWWECVEWFNFITYCQ